MKINLAWYWVALIIVGAITVGYAVPLLWNKMKAKSEEEVIEDAKETIEEAQKRMSRVA